MILTRKDQLNDGPPVKRIIALGAGVQSTAMALMAVHGVITDKVDACVFSDTGWEPKNVYDHLAWLKEILEAKGMKVHIVTIGNLRDDIISSIDNNTRIAQPPFYTLDEHGNKGKLRRNCTRDYKINPMRKQIRTIMGLRPKQHATEMVEQWFGISTDEAQRMKPPDVKWSRHRYPLIELDMSRQDCIDWMIENGYPEPPRSACIGCPFHSNKFWRYLRDTSPGEWSEAVEFDKRVRAGVRGSKFPNYVHPSRIPLGEVELDNELKQRRFDFGEECEGMCGV